MKVYPQNVPLTTTYTTFKKPTRFHIGQVPTIVDNGMQFPWNLEIKVIDFLMS